MCFLLRPPPLHLARCVRSYRSSRAPIFFSAVVVPGKTAAVGDGYRPVLAAGMIAAGVGHHSPPLPLGARGLFRCCCCLVILCPQGRSWAVAGGLPNHDRQRPLPTCTPRDDNCRLYPMACFAATGKGGLGRSRASLLMFWPLCDNEPRAKHGRDEFGF